MRYIQQRAAEHDGRIVSIGQLVLFSTETGDAWLLDPLDHLAARLARDGDPEPTHIEDTDTTFVGRFLWRGAVNADVWKLRNIANPAAVGFTEQANGESHAPIVPGSYCRSFTRIFRIHK